MTRNGQGIRGWPILISSAVAVMLFCVSGAALEAWKERPAYGIDFWREAEGLPQARVRAIAQTRDGYIWLGTDNGAVRFNGAEFTGFSVETGAIRDNEVWALQEDDLGGLWLGTYGGGLTLFKDGRFTTLTTADGLPDDVVTELSKDSDGSIWIATPSGACRYSRGTLTSYTTRDGLSDNFVTAVCADNPEGVFVATGSRLHKLTGGRFTECRSIADSSGSVIDYLLTGRDGSLWIGFHNGLLKRWKDGTCTTYELNPSAGSHVFRLYEDPEGTLWVATQRGLHRMKRGNLEPFPTGEEQARLGVVYSMCADREGSLWMGLESNGLARLRTRHLTTITADDGLPNDSTRSVFEDRQGNIWIGTASGFAKCTKGHVIPYTMVGAFRIGTVRAFAEDHYGNIWIASGPQLFIMRKNRIERHPGFTATVDIKALYRDSKGRMWAGTDGEGLFLFDRGKVTAYRTTEGLLSNQIRSILEDRRGDLWVGTQGGGVSCYSNGAFINYTSRDGLAGDRILAIHEDDEGALWFATRKGLSRLKNGAFFTYTAESGLFGNFVYSILDDDSGNFWFSCAQGLFRVSKAELRDFAAGKIKKITSVDYGVRDGMETSACNVGNQPTAWKAADGSLMFCSMKGIVIAGPTRIPASAFIPPVYVEKVTINKQDQPPDQTPQIPIRGGEVEIHYAALSYLAPERVRFKYKLEGFDSEWVDAGARRFAYYASLPPGRYEFRVIAGNTDGAWNETGASFAFYLKPRFYQTPVFLGIVTAGAILMVLLMYRLRMLGLRARYSAVLAERNRIAREIHDTLAQNLAGIALQLDSITMQLTDCAPGLRQRLDQACDMTRYSLAEARRAVADLRADELDRRELAAALPEIAGKLTANSSVRSEVQVVGSPRRLNPVTEKNLLRIFQEAVANAVKHAGARTIEVELRYSADCLVLRVMDDGSGFDTEKIIPMGVGHYGLTGMRERAERIGGRFTLSSKPGQGTELLVEVPFSA